MVKYLEIVEDGDQSKLKDLFQKLEENNALLKRFLISKNYKRRTPLHLVCLTGQV